MGIADAYLLSSELEFAFPMIPPRRASPTFVEPCFIYLVVELRCYLEETGPLIAALPLTTASIDVAPALALVAAVLALSISLAYAAAAFCAAIFAASRFFYLSISGS